VGLHGTGIAMGLVHMPVGTKHCCGVVEIFPAGAAAASGGGGGGGEKDGGGGRGGGFKHTRGHGNMARRLGHRYARMTLSALAPPAATAAATVAAAAASDGTATAAAGAGAGGGGKGGPVYVPPEALRAAAQAMLREVAAQPSCVLPAVIKTPL